MMGVLTYYMLLTAAPLKQNKKYQELLPQNTALTSYVRYFWGSAQPYLRTKETADCTLVIPDTCVDIIYHIDETANTITGGFCGINDASFWDYDNKNDGHLCSVFAIRFFAWGAYPFAEDSMKGTRNVHDDVRARFDWLDRILRAQLFEKRSLAERSAAAEALLLARLTHARQNSVVTNAAQQIILSKGTQGVTGLAGECFVSSRQLERLFHEYIGITPKKLCSMVRYQFLWNEILRNPRFQALDAVCKYGFTDQSHLMREFKRHHTMDIAAARQYALQRSCKPAAKDVGNIQDVSRRISDNQGVNESIQAKGRDE